jgi:hypothetical protein
MFPVVSSRMFARNACLIAISMISVACGQNQGEEPKANVAPVGTTANYD